MSTPPINVDCMVLYCPTTFLSAVDQWDPCLAIELDEYISTGTVAFIDWNLYREPVDVVVGDLNKVQGTKIIWGGYPQYQFIQAVVPRLKGEVIVKGFPVDEGKKLDLPTERWVGEKRRRDLQPNHSLINLEAYWEHAGLPYSLNTLDWKARVPFQWKLPSGAMNAKDVAKAMRRVKLWWWFDSFTWLDDVLVNPGWTQSVLQQLEEYEIRAGFTAKGDWRKAEAGVLRSLRESGCHVLDIGPIPVSMFDDEDKVAVLRVADRVIRQSGILPDYRLLVDEDTTKDNLRKAVETGVNLKIVNKPLVDKRYLPEHDVIMEMNRDQFNPTTLTSLEFQGALAAAERGLIGAII